MSQYAFSEQNYETDSKVYDNEMEIEFDSLSQNESFARTVVASFASQMNPTLEEIADIKTAVSEAVTNSIIHGYRNKKGRVKVRCGILADEITIDVIDDGIGIEDVSLAMQPLYSNSPDVERAGMGFAFMSAFMDELKVTSKVNEGTTVRMRKKILNT